MPTRNEIINTELTSDPLGRGYAGMSDDAARDDANAPNRTMESGVWLSDAFQFLSHEMNDPGAGLNPWPILVMLKELAEDGTLQGDPVETQFSMEVAINLMGFFAKATDADGKLIFLDFSKPSMSFSWDTMVDVGIISQDQLDTLITLSNVPQSRAAELGTGTWTTGDVTRNK